MSYWAYYGWRWIVLAIFAYWGYTIDGWDGAFWMTVLIGILAFIVYTMMDAWGKLTNAFARTQNNTVNFNNYRNEPVETNGMKGEPHRDPTRPAMTEEDYIALLNTYKHRKG